MASQPAGIRPEHMNTAQRATPVPLQWPSWRGGLSRGRRFDINSR